MTSAVSGLAARIKVLTSRLLRRLGLGDDSFLTLLAVLIGIVTAAAAVGFHQLIDLIRDVLYKEPGADVLYGTGLALLILWPTVGGLVVGILTNYVSRVREGHGVIDVIESVIRSRGFIRPVVAIEKIFTSAVTIGSGGSCGAEGPIVQIGAAISSGFGQLFGLARQQMPIIIGCGAAAGISAIFNSPIGGVLFALEVILQDFSIRTFTPVVMASVIANVTTHAIFKQWLDVNYLAIFAMPDWAIHGQADLAWRALPSFIVLGILCGIVGAGLTRLMAFSESRFSKLKFPRALKPALGGAMLGIVGVGYVLIFGWWALGEPKPIAFQHYPMPAFFGDGYGAIQRFLQPDFYADHGMRYLLCLLAFMTIAKLVGTCMTLGSGGSGGVIAPALFLGAAAGGLLGLVLEHLGTLPSVQPEVYALVGMGAALAAVVHAPLASILILFDLTHDYKLILPAMLASIVATGTARLIFKDSIYTMSLRLRGVRVGSSSDLSLLRRLNIEQVDLDPAAVVRTSDPFQRVLDLTGSTGATDFVVLDKAGLYAGMVIAEDIKTALMAREAIPLLLVGEMMRTDIPLVRSSDDLAAVLDAFSRHEVGRLPVTISNDSGKIIGLVSRAALMKRYQMALAES